MEASRSKISNFARTYIYLPQMQVDGCRGLCIDASRVHDFHGSAAPGGRARLPAVVSTSGRIHGEFLRLLCLLADKKTKLHFRALDEAIDVDSEAYCWRRSGFFWRMRASLGLACAQATTLSSQVFGKGNPRSRAGRPSV